MRIVCATAEKLWKNPPTLRVRDHIRFELGDYGSDHRLRSELVRVCRSRLAEGGHAVEPQDVLLELVFANSHRLGRMSR